MINTNWQQPSKASGWNFIWSYLELPGIEPRTFCMQAGTLLLSYNPASRMHAEWWCVALTLSQGSNLELALNAQTQP